MAKRTRGQRLLEGWFAADASRTKHALGAALGITGQAVSMWLRPREPSYPAEHLWPALKEITGIDGVLFLSPARKAKREKNLRRREAATAALTAA